MTNSNKLRGRITEKGYTMASFAEAVRISRPCLRQRINGKTDFKASEIEKICALLDISHSDMCSYFFTADVPNMGTRA